MPYITIAELETDYGAREVLQLSDKNNTKVRDDVRLQSAIERASAQLDMALAKCYVLPLAMSDGSALAANVTFTLREWCGRIARFLLTDDARLGGTAESAPHETRARYLEVTKALNALDPTKAGGCLLLPGVRLLDTTVDAARNGADVIFGDSGRVFGRDPGDIAEQRFE
jgi:phage gp36-like protein